MIDHKPPDLDTLEPFARVAPFYDQLMEGVPYRFWLKYLKGLWQAHKHEPFKVLDLACGTGTMANLLAQEGLLVTGVDVAGSMLEQAITKSAAAGLYIKYVKQDAAELELTDVPFDTVICLFDSLNNIIDKSRLQNAFNRTYRHISPGGLFIFDLNTSYAFKQGMFNQRSRLSDGPLQYNWTSSFDEKSSICTIEMKFSFRHGSGEVETFEEVHQQRSYRNGELLQMLDIAGFSDVDIYDAYSFTEAKKRSDRIFVVAKVPDEQETENEES